MSHEPPDPFDTSDVIEDCHAKIAEQTRELKKMRYYLADSDATVIKLLMAWRTEEDLANKHLWVTLDEPTYEPLHQAIEAEIEKEKVVLGYDVEKREALRLAVALEAIMTHEDCTDHSSEACLAMVFDIARQALRIL